MEPLPRGANFQRALMLWEIGLHIAGNPNTPYYGPRDVCIAVGSGSNETFKPWLRMSTGSPILAHAVCRNELEAAMINPSGLLTQAYRGTGIFAEKLPVRIVAVYPSLDHFVYLMHPRTGLIPEASAASNQSGRPSSKTASIVLSRIAFMRRSSPGPPLSCKLPPHDWRSFTVMPYAASV